MFGKHKSGATQAALSQDSAEPVHVFDQTNGVLKRFEEINNPHATDRDYEDTSQVVTAGVVGNGVTGGFMGQ